MSESLALKDDRKHVSYSAVAAQGEHEHHDRDGTQLVAQDDHGHSHGHSHSSSHSHSHSHSGSRVQLSPRSAFARGDVEASIRAHAQKRQDDSKSEEGHNTETGEYIKSIVYGGLDGIITTFATVTSVAGADFSAAVVVVLGISHLFADGLSMGLGDYMSSQAEVEYTESERKREKWEMDNNMKGEIEEMIDLYVLKGVSETDARIIINTLAKYPDAFLDHMMTEELGLLPPSADQGFSPKKAGMVTMCSFMAFGSIPLIPYLIALIPGLHMSPDLQLIIAVLMTLLTLFLLGAFKGKVVETGRAAWWKSGLLMACNGSMAAIVGYACGWLISQWMDLPPGAG